MGRFVVSNVMSLDGYVDTTGPEPGLPIRTEAQAEAFNATNLATLREASALVAGRTTYAMFESYWPGLEQDESTDAVQREISALNNRMGKLVVSDTYEVPAGSPWAEQTRVVRRGDAPDAGRALKDDGDVVLFGSAETLPALLAAGVVDEVRLLVVPVVLGAGVPALPAGTDVALTSTEVIGDSGCVQLRYAVL